MFLIFLLFVFFSFASYFFDEMIEGEFLRKEKGNGDLCLQVDLEVHTTLYVTDVNDNPPRFERLFYTADVNEV